MTRTRLLPRAPLALALLAGITFLAGCVASAPESTTTTTTTRQTDR